MAEVITNADYISIFTNGWFEIQEQIPAPTSTSGYYREYSDMPSWITKCTGPRYNNERELYDLMITEVYNQRGVCVTYYAVTYDQNYDRIWGEDNDRRFSRKFDIMVFYMLPREEKLWTKFGIDGMDQFSMYASKRHFRTASQYDWEGVSASAHDAYIPKIGDIIMADYNQFIYEVVEVKEEIGMYLLSKQHVWELIVKPFRDEKIEVPAELSGTMPEMESQVNRKSDRFDTNSNVDTRKVPIKYQPPSNEKPSNNPWANW